MRVDYGGFGFKIEDFLTFDMKMLKIWIQTLEILDLIPQKIEI